jgi:ABC-type phosphate transport system substrate-binding protein
MFTSVTNAMIYYKCEFADEENKEYLGLNISSGLPVPADVKPFTKAIRGKKGQQWKEREPEVLREVYEAKFTNTPNSNDDAENLTPLRALLLTRDAHLYSNSRTRNELLERVRDVLRRIVGNQ